MSKEKPLFEIPAARKIELHAELLQVVLKELGRYNPSTYDLDQSVRCYRNGTVVITLTAKQTNGAMSDLKRREKLAWENVLHEINATMEHLDRMVTTERQRSGCYMHLREARLDALEALYLIGERDKPPEQ